MRKNKSVFLIAALSLIAAYFLCGGVKYVVAIKVGGHTSEVFSGSGPQEADQIKEMIEQAIAKKTPLLKD